MENDDEYPPRPRWLAVLAVTTQVLAGMLPVITALTVLVNALHGTPS